jgi:hypothetical protein
VPWSAGSARLLDEQGMELATVVVAGRLVDGRFLYIEKVEEGAGHLLNHRFGRGRKRVILESNGCQRRARLGTRWFNNHREWQLELTPPPVSADRSSPRAASGAVRNVQNRVRPFTR